VLFSTGDFQTVTLKQPDLAIKNAADALRRSLASTGFKSSGAEIVWRDHMLIRANAELWSRSVKPGEKVSLAGQSIDYVVMVRGVNGARQGLNSSH
jgi:hypothetical protein